MERRRGLHEDEIRRLYDAFNRREIDAVLERLTDDVLWANGMEGGHVQGRANVRAYWLRQFEAIQPHVEPEAIAGDEQGRVVVGVHQLVRAPDGELLADERVEHVYTLATDGRIARFDIRGAASSPRLTP